jgi:hypothetical protein
MERPHCSLGFPCQGHTYNKYDLNIKDALGHGSIIS